MAYDTTILDNLHSDATEEKELPACLQRDLLDSPYFPKLQRSVLIGIIALCAIFVMTSVNRLNHTDLWGHMNFGRWIVQNQHFPTADPFGLVATEAASERTFLNVPWLSQVLGYAIYQVMGAEGLVLAHAAIVTAACGVLMIAIRKREVNIYWAVAGGVLAYILSLPVVGTIRPQLFGMLGAALVLLACSCMLTKRHPMFWLPIVFLLWANLHGSFVIGLAMLGLAVLGISWNVRKNAPNFQRTLFDSRFQTAWTTLAVCTVACCINPIGPKLMLSVLSFGGNSVLTGISEWRAMSPMSFTGILFFASVAMLFGCMRYSARKFELFDVLMLILFAVATFSSIRMLAWWALVLPWALAPHAELAWQKLLDKENAREPADEINGMATVIAMGFVFMTLLMAPPSQGLLSGRPRGITAVTTTDTPVYLAAEIDRRKLDAPLFTPMDWADYLMWRNDGRMKPLVYGHVHLTDPETWDDYRELAIGSVDWYDITKKHGIKYVALHKSRNEQLIREVFLASQEEEPRARIIYQDQQAILAELLDVVHKETPAEEPAA
jgi:hypothetical protein